MFFVARPTAGNPLVRYFVLRDKYTSRFDDNELWLMCDGLMKFEQISSAHVEDGKVKITVKTEAGWEEPLFPHEELEKIAWAMPEKALLPFAVVAA